MSANPNIVWIDPDTCEKCNICVEVFGCPAIQLGTGGLVPWIHAELCNGNGSCIQVCPVGAIKRPSAARFGGGTGAPAGGKSSEQEVTSQTNQQPGDFATGDGARATKSGGEGYKGGPTQGSKTEFAGHSSEKCK